MVMELGLSRARWTANSGRFRARAPLSGLGSTRWTSTVPTPFGPAPGAGLSAYSALASSGFQATTAPSQQEVVMDPLLVLGKGPFTVKKEPVPADMTPSMVIRMRFTDRGSLTKAVLDAQVRGLLKQAKLKVSKSTTFKPVDVTWRWEHDSQADFYYPVVQTPAAWVGMRYSGNAIQLPVYTASADDLAKLPNQVWVYTMGVTTPQNTMSDEDGARVVTLLKQAMVNMRSADFYANVELTVRGCPASLFETGVSVPLKMAGMSGLILLVAYNMVSAHVGSERL